MIRIGSSSTGVSSSLNSFHAQTEAPSGLYTNAVGSKPPPSVFGLFASQYTEAPYIRLGGTLFVDPYGFTVLPSTIGNLYFTLTIKGSVLTDLKWANSYTGIANKLVPDGKLVETSSASLGNTLYVRLKSSALSYRIFTYENGISSQIFMCAVGPENSTKPVPVTGGFQLSGLEGALAAHVQVYTHNSGKNMTCEKNEYTVNPSGTVFAPDKVWTEWGLSNSNPITRAEVHLSFVR